MTFFIYLAKPNIVPYLLREIIYVSVLDVTTSMCFV